MQYHVRFKIGQPIHHKLFDYRGVIIEADDNFQQTEAWYNTMTNTNPPKDKPWYYVLVHDSPCMTYVAECNLEPDLCGKSIEHPLLKEFFDNFKNGLYTKTSYIEQK